MSTHYHYPRYILIFDFLLSITTIAVSETRIKPCDSDFSVKIKSYIEYPNGSLLDIQSKSMYENGTYWKESNGDEEMIEVCPCLLSKPCLRKCCPMEEVTDLEGLCVKDENFKSFSPNVTDDFGENPRIIDGVTEYGILYGVVEGCDSKFFLEPGVIPGDGYYLRASDAKIVLYERNVTYGPYVFCLEFVRELGEYRPFICEPPQRIDSFAMKLYPYTLLTSTVFLFVAFLVYCILPDLRNLHGKILMSHMFSLSVAFLSFSLISFLGRRMSLGTCVFFAFVIEFSLIASFFWLNVMCFDICITFRRMRPTRKTTSKEEGKQFIFYSLYAWGSPTILLIITVIMQFAPELPDYVIKPEFGKIKCYFNSYESLAAYLYAPMTTLLVSNIIMFIITAVSIRKINKETAVLKSCGSGRHSSAFVDYNKQRFILYVKLFIVMGVTWMMDFVAWVINAPAYYFYITEIWNSLQGFFIFVVFVWKKSIRNMLKQRLNVKVPIFLQGALRMCSSRRCCSGRLEKTQEESSASVKNTTTTSFSSSPSKPNDEKIDLKFKPPSNSFIP